MDKYEYRVSAEQINALIEQKEYMQAVKIADTIDWRRVKSIAMLCKVSELYKMNRRYEDSKEMLLLAYERQPGSRKIIYSLCELSIKLEELVLAIEYYKEFVQVAPKDTGRYILQYRLYEAQDVSLEERIAVLEEYKKRDYREKWAYELAYLYHRIGLATRCIEECDELILWFGEGKYVIKAMELKMLHSPLSENQRVKYDNRYAVERAAAPIHTQNEETIDNEEQGGIPIQIKSVDPSNAPTTRIPNPGEEVVDATPSIDIPQIPVSNAGDTLDIHVPALDMGEYNTINLQKELAKNLAKMLEQEDMEASDATRALPIDTINDITPVEVTQPEEVAEVPVEEVTNAIQEEPIEEILEEEPQEVAEQQEELPEQTEKIIDFSMTRAIVDEVSKAIGEMKENDQITEEDLLKSMEGGDYENTTVSPISIEPIVNEQITGQLSFDDIMSEWEQTKKANEEKHVEEMRRKVLEQTGPIFKNFDEEAKASVQADLAMIDANVTTLNTAEINGLEEKLLGGITLEEPTEDKEEVVEEPAVVTESENIKMDNTFDISLEKMVLDALNEQEPLNKNEPKGDTGFIIADLATKEEPKETQSSDRRALTKSEKEMFGSIAQTKEVQEQVSHAIDHASLAPCIGNVIITGEKGTGALIVAKNLIKMLSVNDDNFSGKVAKITGELLNTKDINATLNNLENGALIIEDAGKLEESMLQGINDYLNDKKQDGIFIILVDKKKEIDLLKKSNANLLKYYDLYINIAVLDNDGLVSYGKEYASEKEFAIDDMGVLALYTRIADMQTNDHAVTVDEVKAIVDEAIASAEKKSVSHFMDVIFAKRYDNEDMIILREKDFLK